MQKLIILFLAPLTLASQYNVTNPDCLTSLDFNHEVIIRTPYGYLEGFNFTAGDPDNPFHVNLAVGISYAYHAVGEFRFHLPLRLRTFSLLQAKIFERRCFPGANYPGMINFNEDCLFLNIFMPHPSKAPSNGFPLLFFIHGGLFNFGGSDDLDMISIIKNYLQRGIAVVTANYRLGAFGFFQTPESRTPKNLGLWDLEKAFTFIFNAAKEMGLDATKITVGGVDGGAVLAEMLTLRPSIRNHVNGLILIGGSILTPWAISPNVFNASIELAKNIGFRYNNTRDILYGIRAAEPEQLVEKDLSQNRKDFMRFTPDFDPTFFYFGTLKKCFYQAKPIPIFMLTTNNEGALRTTNLKTKYYPAFNEWTKISNEKQVSFSCDDFNNFVIKYFNQIQTDEIIKEYACESGRAFEVYNKMIGDFWFHIPMGLSATMYAALDHNVYVYVVNTSDSTYEKLTGSKTMPSVMLNDVYLFSDKNPWDLMETEETEKLYKNTQNILLDSITNFVKGDYSQMTAVDPESYAKLNPVYHEIEDGKMMIQEKKPFNEKLSFWRNFFRKYGFDLLNPRLDKEHDLFFFDY